MQQIQVVGKNTEEINNTSYEWYIGAPIMALSNNHQY